MNLLLIQEAGRHEANREFREALSMQRALSALGHKALAWGLGYANFGTPFEKLSAGADVVFLMEQYDQTGWVPDISGFRGPRVFWTVDSHCNLAEHQAQVKRQKITHLLSSTEAFLEAYDAPVKAWFPNCYDDTLIRPMPEVEKQNSIGFCGNLNNRGPWLDHIDLYFKPLISPAVKRDIFVIGQAMVQAINSYMIHFNRNIALDLNYRTFETAGCGTLLLTNQTPGLEKLFDIGREIVTYETGEDVLRMIRHLLENPEEREAIAAAGYARAKRDHTYLERAKLLCHILEST